MDGQSAPIWQVGFYTEVDGMETMPVPPGRPSHLGPYPGGCLLRLHTPSGALTPLVRLPDGEGVITMATDLLRGRVFCLLWPSGRLAVLSSAAPGDDWRLSQLLDYPGRGEGEGAHPRSGNYRPVCRVTPREFQPGTSVPAMWG